MSNQSLHLLSVALWIVLVLALWGLARLLKRPTVGLALAYMLTFFIAHWPGAFLYLLPWYPGLYPSSIVLSGFRQSTLGAIAFTLGVLILAPMIHKQRESAVSTPASSAVILNRWLPLFLVLGGLASYFLLFPVSGRIPSLTAVTSTVNQLVSIGIALGCWQAWYYKEHNRLRRWLLAVLILPLITVTSQGFLSYGIVAALVVITFLSGFLRLRRRYLPVILAVVYLGLSLYVTYMRDRDVIREVVWGGSTVELRIDTVWDTLVGFEWFDLDEEEQLARIDGRLNQNWLVGASVYYLEHGYQSYARGETLTQATLAFIPRALWPGKPQRAGSGDIVATYTGLTFSETTSVGVGQVMEFYINFGTSGVLLGFLLLGTVIGVIDLVAAQRLAQHDLVGLLRWYLPGLGLLQPGGSLVDISAAVGGGIVAALLINQILHTYVEQRPTRPLPRYAPRRPDADETRKRRPVLPVKR